MTSAGLDSGNRQSDSLQGRTESGVTTGAHLWAKFLKDYRPVDW